MEYERIHKVQTAVISPSKLRMRLLGSSNSHHGVKKKEANIIKSATASPSRLEELEFSKNSLLEHDFVETDIFKSGQLSTSKVGSAANTANSEASRQEENSTNGSENSNFEFQREERSPGQHFIPAPLVRQVPSKWNDAEKWIMNRHSMHSNPIFSKKPSAQNSQNHGTNAVISNNNVRVAPELNGSANRDSGVTECGSLSGRKRGILRKKHSHMERTINATSVQSVSMRDIGTEMTPIASQEQSKAGTPVGPATPTFSPLSSIPSTPKRGPPSSSSSEATVDSRLWVQKKLRTVQTPDRELQIRTRQEIAALGLKLGKFNIATWASKEEFPEESECDNNFDEGESVKRLFEARAAVWEESQKSKLVSRYKREEVKIQAWETCQQAKFEAEKRRIEAQAEQIKFRVQQKTAKKLCAMRLKVEGKQAKMEVKKSRRVARITKEVEQIRRTGRAPTSCLRCCSWFSFGLLTK